MTSRASILNADRVAASYLQDSNARARIKDGYTRIDPLKIAESRGLSVLLRKLEKLLGAFLENPEPGILINNDRPTGLIHMTGAHELGHYAMRHGPIVDHAIDVQSTDPKEAEADAFAYSLLSPRWLIAHTLRERHLSPDKLRNPSVVYQTSLRLGLSYSAMVSTLVRTQIMSFSDAQAMREKQPQQCKSAGVINDQKLERNQDLWILGSADRDCILEPLATDLFILDAPNNLASGYLWTIDQARAEGFLLVPKRAGKDVAKATANEEHVFVEGNAQYALERAQGTDIAETTNFTFFETQPWRALRPDDQAIAFRAEFERNGAGLSDGTKRRRLEALRHGN